MTKKILAVFLAALMAFSVFSVLGSAVELDPVTGLVDVTEPATIDINVAFVDASEAPIAELGSVTPGSTVKARVSVGTNYYTGGATLRFYYPTSFFSDNYSSMARYPGALNSANASVGTGKITDIGIMKNGTSGDETIIDIATYIDDWDADAFQLDGSTWMFEITLTVKADATGTAGFYAKASDFGFDETPGGYNNIEYAVYGDCIGETIPLEWASSSDFTITSDSNEVTTSNSVTFNACGGVFASNNEETLEVPASGGIVGEDYNIPVAGTDFSYAGYTFLGWYEDAAYTTPAFAEGATQFEMPVEQGVVYYAKWNKNVTIHFDETGNAIIADIEASGGTEWAAADKPSVTDSDKPGYRFMGWEGEGVVNGNLPDNYPVATAETDEYTYTATWSKYITITFDANGGTFSDGNTGTYSGSTVYGGAAWDSSVPTYNVSGYTAAGISRPGYALLGWNDGSGRITQFPANYPADDTTYTAVWQPYNVYITYIVDGETVSFTAAPYSQGSITVKTVEDVAEWHIGAPDSQTTYAPGDTYTFTAADVTDGVTFYGVTDETGNVTATFDANGGKFADDSTSKDVETAKGTAPVAPAAPQREGYTFIGWTPAVGTISANTTYTAVWNVDPALVIYLDYDGTEIERFTQAYGEEIEAPADPEREGYTFTGWAYVDSDDLEYTGDTVPAGGLTATAQYTVNTYKITYDVAGGTYTDATFTGVAENIAFGANIPAVPAATREGYKAPPTWTYADEDGVAYTGTTMPAFDLVATAEWEKDQFTVSFESNGGTAVASITDDFEASIAKPQDPTKAGQSFAGWYYDENLQNAVQWPLSMPAEDITLYAKWGNNIINIKFMDGENQLYTLSDEFGETVNYDSIVTDRAGYTFDKWYDTATFDNPVTLPATYPENDLTVYGRWIANEYTITYVPNGGTWADGKTGVETITYDTLPTLLCADVISREGYSFGCIYTDSGFTVPFTGTDYVQIFDNATLVAENRYEMTAYIKWNINTYNAVFYSDGQVFRSVPYEYNAPVGAPPDSPSKDGYSFRGWADSENATAADVIDFATAGITMPVGGLTYYAVFERNAVTVNFYAYGNGTPLGEYDETNPLTGSDDYDIGADIDLATIIAPTYPNFTFVGWVTGDGDDYGPDEEITVEDAMNFYAVYERVAVKLVPTDENSTAMIERDGVVETWNNGLATTPYGVTEIKEPNAETYDATGYETYYVYGLKANITEAEIADYVKATGDGRIEIQLNGKNKSATGAIIKVIDNVDDSVVEQFYIIIFGDIDGDGDISAQDSSRLKLETRTKEWSDSSKQTYLSYLVKAADLDLDGDISAQDSARIGSVTRNAIVIDQKTGKAS